MYGLKIKKLSIIHDLKACCNTALYVAHLCDDAIYCLIAYISRAHIAMTANIPSRNQNVTAST